MKKRRELDALVNNGKIGRRKPTKNGKHELLRSETDSSEVEFQVPAQKSAVIRKTRKRCHICGTCVSVCAFFMITLCLLACGGLIWLQVGLRKELDDLRVKLISVETGNQDTPEALQSVHSSIKDINGRIGKLKDVQTKEDDLAKQVKTLNDDVGKLSKSVSEASKITNLPSQVEEIKQEVATVGSTVSTIQDQVKSFKTFTDSYDKDHADMREAIHKIKKQMSSLRSGVSNTSTTPVAPDESAVTEMNTRLSSLSNAFKARIDALDSALRLVQITTKSLSNRTSSLEKRVSSDRGATDSNLPNVPSNVGLDLDEIAVQVTEKVQTNLTASTKVGMKMIADHFTKQIGDISDRVDVLEGQFSQNERPNSTVTPMRQVGGETPSGIVDVGSTLSQLQQQLKELNESKAEKGLPSTAPGAGANGSVSQVMVRDLISTAIAAYMKQDKEDEKKYEADFEKLNRTVDVVSGQFKAQAASLLAVSSTQEEYSRRLYKLEHKTATNEKEDSEMPHRPLHLTGIDSKEDLRSYFYIWDGDDDGKVSYNEIRSQMGIHMPPEDRMKNYDYNGDGSYSEYELLAAMGFVTYTTPPPLDVNGTTSAPEFLHVPSIQTKEDLRTNFYRWDRDGDSYVRYDDLPMFLGSSTPRKHLFKPWDTNGDGQYSLAELIVAFGFPPDTTLAPTTPGPTTTATTAKPTPEPLMKIEVKGVESESTLEALFTYWDKNRDGFASYNELHEALGKAIPSPKYLAPYDEDGDGLFTQHNLKMAFGFIPVTDEIAQGRTQVPLSQLTHNSSRKKRSLRSKKGALRNAFEQRLHDHSRK